jgi:3'-5' exoribonuclease
MAEQHAPDGLASMPRLFRLVSLTRTPINGSGYQMEASLYHERASFSATWTVRQPDTRLKDGVLVSPRYVTHAVCDDGRLRIGRLVLIEHPIRTENLFRIVPPAWVPNHDLLLRASALFDQLDQGYKELVNGVLWNAAIFQGFCTGPSSLNGHHAERNGNLRHTVEVGEAVMKLLPQHPAADPQISLAAALLHDVGKALEYEPTPTGWRFTDLGKINGHKQLIGDWIAVAAHRMRLVLPRKSYSSLRHAIGASSGVPFESGYREPNTPEARLLSIADRSSGSGDLYARQAPKEGDWGCPHPHLGGKAPYFAYRPPMRQT